MKEQEVIKRLNFHKEYARLSSNRVVISETDLETVLSMLKQNSAELAEKSAEIEKKDKMIDLMAEEIKKRATCPLDDYNYDLDCENKCNNNTKECWKQYFERKAKDGRL